MTDAPHVYTVTNKGMIFFGSQTTSARQAITQGMSFTSSFAVSISNLLTDLTVALVTKGITTPPDEMNLLDSRANQILVANFDGWYVFPSPEIFSRHSGTCIVLGDRKISSLPREVEIGDCFRLGSVGLVVSEMRYPNGEEKRLETNALQYLKEEALKFDMQEDEAFLAAEEEDKLLQAESGAAVSDNGRSSMGEDHVEETCLSGEYLNPFCMFCH